MKTNFASWTWAMADAATPAERQAYWAWLWRKWTGAAQADLQSDYQPDHRQAIADDEKSVGEP